MTQCILVDMDGTLSDASHRKHFVVCKPKNWNAFNKGMVDDPVIEHTARLVKVLHEEMPIIILTARPIEYAQQTMDWLAKHSIPYDDLYMRPLKDYRQDFIVKKELLDLVRKNGYDPFLAFDDREAVAQMYRQNGVPCMLCAEPAFEAE
jgi:hypothetical protein